MKYLISLFFVFFNTIVFSQELKKIAENTVSPTTKVFTYKLKDAINSRVQDENPVQKVNTSQQNIIDRFLNIKGVQKASFDKATKTYTVVTNSETKLSEKLNFK
jgi:hypothetical protein